MSQHRIVRSEADQPKPLVYLSIYRSRRGGTGRYLAAALAGALLTLAIGVTLAALSGNLSGVN